MKYRFITIIHYLKLTKPDCRIPLASGMISNMAAVLKDVLSYKCDLSLNTIGRHSIDEFENQTFYVVDGEFEEGVTQTDVDTFGTSLTFAFLRQIQALTNDFWTLRDNSIYVRDGFFFVYDKAIEDGVTFKASLSAINTKASTEIEDVTFSKEEIEALAKDRYDGDIRGGCPDRGSQLSRCDAIPILQERETRKEDDGLGLVLVRAWH